MSKYLVDATVTVYLEEVPVHLDGPLENKQQLEGALMHVLDRRLTLLDVKGGRTGDDGYITGVECDSLNHWDQRD